MKTKMNKEKVKQWIKEHKKEVAMGVGLVVIGGVVYLISKKPVKVENIVNSIPDFNYGYLEVPDMNLGTITCLEADVDGLNFVLNDITVANMGDFGKELLKLDGVTEDTTVTAWMGLLNPVTE